MSVGNSLGEYPCSGCPYIDDIRRAGGHIVVGCAVTRKTSTTDNRIAHDDEEDALRVFASQMSRNLPYGCSYKTERETKQKIRIEQLNVLRGIGESSIDADSNSEEELSPEQLANQIATTLEPYCEEYSNALDSLSDGKLTKDDLGQLLHRLWIFLKDEKLPSEIIEIEKKRQSVASILNADQSQSVFLSLELYKGSLNGLFGSLEQLKYTLLGLDRLN